MIKINNVQLTGTINAISSKSMAHRYLIASALADKTTKLYLPNISDDIQRTMDCLVKLGANIVKEDEYLIIHPIDIEKLQSTNTKDIPSFDMGESGTTLRFMIPIISSLLNKSEFTGRGRLPERPLKDLTDIIKDSGSMLSNDKIPFVIENRFTFNEVSVSGGVSSQYISGLLLSAPLQNNDVKINIIGRLESKPYVDMTVQVMKEYGIDVIEEQNSYIIKKDSKYTSNGNHEVESDWSNAAFFLVAGAVSEHPIKMDHLNFDSYQGDMKIIELLKQVGATVTIDGNSATIEKNELNAIDIDVSDIPDLLPILSVLASACKGRTRLYNASRLRLKESDRIKSSAEMITNLGGVAIEEDDSLIIEGTGYLQGGQVDSYNDHRIAMSTSIASIICKAPVILTDENAVNKSYISFYQDFEKLGGKICHQ